MIPKETIDKVLTLYISEAETEAFRKPMVQGDYVFATERHVLIRIAKHLAIGDYPSRQTPNCAALFNEELNCDEVITTSSLRDLVKKYTKMIPETRQDEAECEECGGAGYVMWKYKTWISEHECPVCLGEGSIEGEAIPTGNVIADPTTPIPLGKVYFRQEYLQTLLDTLELLNEKSFTIVRADPYGANIFVINENVSVIIAPTLRDEQEDETGTY